MTSDDTLASDPPDPLRAQYEELAALTGSLAHEIKNPLSVIRMNMELLAEDFADSETPRERRALSKIDMVTKQCTRLENLLNDFLRFNKVRRLDLRSGSLNEQMERVLDLFTPQANETGVARGGARHVADEEQTLFPHLRPFPECAPLLAALEKEHREHEALEDELGRLVGNWSDEGPEVADETRAAEIARNLVALYRAHIEREEKDLFPIAQKLLAPAVIADLGQQMMDRRSDRGKS